MDTIGALPLKLLCYFALTIVYIEMQRHEYFI